MQRQIAVAEVVIEVVRKDIRNLRLTVYAAGGRVRLSAPLRLHDDAVRAFAVSKLSWIRKKLTQFSRRPDQHHYHYATGETHPHFGRNCLLNVVDRAGASRVELDDHAVINLYVRPDAGRIGRQKALDEWYRANLKQCIPPLISKWQPVIGVKLNEWRIKRMKTRWGTCNITARRIWLNLELAKKPESCLEYVVVHELVHLLERLHNHRFRAYMDEFLPQWRSCRDALGRSAR